MIVKDVFDQDIKIGSPVCYSVTVGQTARMRFGFVVNVTGGRDNRVTVQGYSRNYSYDPDSDREWQQKKWIGKKGSCAHANMKVMIVDPSTFPPDLFAIIEEEARALLTE